ncbi:peptidylprolyl isomerase [Lentzea tibetensis]|uniref:Peptidyl-prolyl cis-trans isomerase n=1 Tax=Lentzea tibetensis TaxID=2591470 RepID=A0A563F0N7_9PSEU|nr:peptidylprolyl isomerase [Lentzea tibetensis]TWP53352.1 peptidylprolyl isomerase [Lentzea tibetensis]
MKLLLAVLLALSVSPVASASPATTHCEFTPTPENPAARPVHRPSPRARSQGTVHVTILTNYGTVVAELDRANAPCGVHNFAHLARSFFYTHTQCFRLTNYDRLGVLQCGDLIEAEKGGPGYKFVDEVTGQEKYPRGTIAMGNQGPGTNGSEFFVVHSQALIRPVYTILGRVTHGMDALDRIVAAGIIPGPNGEPDGLPRKPVRILHVIAH